MRRDQRLLRQLTLRIERDVAFWANVVSHPQVAHVMQGQAAETIGLLIEQMRVMPLAGDHGGYIYIPLDSFGRVVELHTLLTPEGWGRKAIEGGAESLNFMFQGCDLVITHHVLDWPRSRPWKSFGFKPCGRPYAANALTLQTWSLSQSDWEVSPARNRLCPSSPPSLQ